MTKNNFLLGKGERLVEDIVGVRGGGSKVHPYSFSEAKTRILPMLDEVVVGIDHLPTAACPDDQAVATVTLNPEYIEKSYFPNNLLRSLDLELVGSRPQRITPEKVSRDRQPKETITITLFVMGSRWAFRAWSTNLPDWWADRPGATELITIERVAAPAVGEKVKGDIPASGKTLFEVVLHADSKLGERSVLPQFQEYLSNIGTDHKLSRRFYAGGLCFVELDIAAELAEKVATFTAVRALRQMPRLRITRPPLRTSRTPMRGIALKAEEPLDTSIRAAIFDGGVPGSHPLGHWVKTIEPAGVVRTAKAFEKHGVAVTSAFLFRHIDPSMPLSRPYAPVDHYRVLDTAPGQDPYELYEVLERVDKVLVE